MVMSDLNRLKPQGCCSLRFFPSYGHALTPLLATWAVAAAVRLCVLDGLSFRNGDDVQEHLAHHPTSRTSYMNARPPVADAHKSTLRLQMTSIGSFPPS